MHLAFASLQSKNRTGCRGFLAFKKELKLNFRSKHRFISKQ